MSAEHKEPGVKVEMHSDLIDEAVRKRFKGNIPGLCARCTHSHIWSTSRSNEPTVLCNQIDSGTGCRVPVDVVECNKFKQLGVLSIWELTQLCLDIDISKPGKKAGFHNDAT